MLSELNQEIYRKFFLSLVLDYEFEDRVICRVLRDGIFAGRLSASNRDEAIAKFKNHEFEEV